MNPRLESAPLTDADRGIWAHVSKYCNEVGMYHEQLQAQRSDGRDAELMYLCQLVWRRGYRRWRESMPYAGKLAVAAHGQLIDCGGAQ